VATFHRICVGLAYHYQRRAVVIVSLGVTALCLYICLSVRNTTAFKSVDVDGSLFGLRVAYILRVIGSRSRLQTQKSAKIYIPARWNFSRT